MPDKANPEVYRKLAEEYRALGKTHTDPQMASAAAALAHEYERKAQELEAKLTRTPEKTEINGRHDDA